MSNDSLDKAGFGHTKEGTPDGLNIGWLAPDKRSFADILREWVASVDKNDANAFIKSVHLEGAITPDDVQQLIAEKKSPSPELANYLSAMVPQDITTWRKMCHRGRIAAGAATPKVAVADSTLKKARATVLENMASAEISVANSGTGTLAEWLYEQIDAVAAQAGTDTNHAASIQKIAGEIGISTEELLGKAKPAGNIIQEKAEALARLFDFQEEKFEEAVETIASAWESAAFPHKQLALPNMLRFLRHMEGKTIPQLGFSQHQASMLCRMEVAFQPSDNRTLNLLSTQFGLTEDEQIALGHAASAYDHATQQKHKDKLTPVVAHFAEAGLTKEAYFGATVRQLGLFTQKPETVIGNIERVAAHFKDKGLTEKAYLEAALKQPQLFAQKPETIIGNIERVAAHFKDRGLTQKAYLEATVRQPALFTRKPETVIGNIERVAAHFKDKGLTQKAYLEAALKQPQLFYQKPETVIGHMNLIIDIYEKDLLRVSDKWRRKPKDAANTPNNPRDLKPLFLFLCAQPKYFALSADNLLLRSLYAAGQDTPTSQPLYKPKHQIEREMRARLGAPSDAAAPVPKVDMPEGIYDENGKPLPGMEDDAKRREAIGPHAKNLLLRALIREGLIEGGLIENTAKSR